MRFSPEFLDRLRHHLPLSEVIGRRMTLKRHGREFQGLCPFHKEKTPSFTVNDEKGFFHCFGCAAHGDAIGFLKDYEKLSYPEAVEKLAGEAGLALPEMTREAAESERRRHTLEDVVAQAAGWFVAQLATPAAAEARSYLDERGLTAETLDRFGIGYGPNSRDALKSALMRQGVSEAMLIEAGLIARTDDGATYDRFRGRVIFPIRSARGKVVAFGGRILPQAQTPNAAKYLNSPETPLFKKGDMLFAYDVAAPAARAKGNLVVAEGYMDVIALHQAGFTTAVAPLGTAVTEAQLQLLWRLVPEPTLCLDSDSAGKRAMLRAAELAAPLLKAGYSLKFAFLPAGEDPDSLIRKSGVPAMLATLKRSRILSEVLWEHALVRFGSETPEKRAALEQYLNTLSTRIQDPLVRRHYQDAFRNRMYGLNRQKKFDKPVPVTPPDASLPGAGDDARHLQRFEEQLMSIVLLHPDILHQSDVEEHFGHMDFLQASLDKLRAAILEVGACLQSADSAALCASLAANGHGEKVETLLHSKTAPLPASSRAKIVSDPHEASEAWQRTYSAYTMKKLEHEMHAAEGVLTRDASQVNLDRFLALQKQLDELRRSRYAVTADDPLF